MANDRTFQVRVRTGHRTDLEVSVYSRTVDLGSDMYVKAPGGGGAILSVGRICEIIQESVLNGLTLEAIKSSKGQGSCNDCKNKGPNSFSCNSCVRRVSGPLDCFESKI